jgi:hypothetical protein
MLNNDMFKLKKGHINIIPEIAIEGGGFMGTKNRGISYSESFLPNKLRRDKAEAMAEIILRLQDEVKEDKSEDL